MILHEGFLVPKPGPPVSHHINRTACRHHSAGSFHQTRVWGEITERRQTATDLCHSGWTQPWSVHPLCAWWRGDPWAPAVTRPAPPRRPGPLAPRWGWNIPEEDSRVKDGQPEMLTSNSLIHQTMVHLILELLIPLKWLRWWTVMTNTQWQR